MEIQIFKYLDEIIHGTEIQERSDSHHFRNK